MENLILFILTLFIILSICFMLYPLIYSIYWWKYFIDNANKFKLIDHSNGYYDFQWEDYCAFITPNKIVSIHTKNNKCLLTGMNFICSKIMYKKLTQS